MDVGVELDVEDVAMRSALDGKNLYFWWTELQTFTY